MNPVYLIGAGNVAWHLGRAFLRSGVPVGGVWSRHTAHARELARDLDCPVIAALSALPAGPGLALIVVPDQAIGGVAAELLATAGQDLTVAHTSGATRLDVLGEKTGQTGVFYPLQTFTRGHDTPMEQVPFLLHSGEEAVMTQLETYARKLSRHVLRVTDEDRAYVHLAAVMLNNFVHHIGHQALRILADRQLDKHLLQPLLAETTRKLMQYPPGDIQTGPAKRGDLRTIEAHLTMLADYPDLCSLYRHLSQSINPKLPL